MTVLPNIYDRTQLREFAAAPESAALTPGEMAQIAALAKDNFGVGPEQSRYKGTMTEPSSTDSGQAAAAALAEPTRA